MSFPNDVTALDFILFQHSGRHGVTVMSLLVTSWSDRAFLIASVFSGNLCVLIVFLQLPHPPIYMY